MPARPEFWIDVGGTFTDCLLRDTDGNLLQHKLLSSGVYRGAAAGGSSSHRLVDPGRRGAPAGFFTGWTLRCVPGDAAGSESDRASRAAGQAATVAAFDTATGTLELSTPLSHAPAAGTRYQLSCDLPAPVIGIRWLLARRLDQPVGPVDVRLGTTRGTNALLERAGGRTAVVTTAGFGDLLRIGDQSRPLLFDLRVRKPVPLYDRVFEVRERIDARGNVLEPLDLPAARTALLEARSAGIDAVAICLLNSYRNPAHEEQLAALARDVGFHHLSTSTRLAPLQRIAPRAETTVVDAYLQPVLADYAASLRAALPEADLQLMTSAGALADLERFTARDSVLSGPAAGVVGAAAAAGAAGFQRAIGFDMGGTSTDVSRYDGQFERRYEMAIEDRETGGRIRIVAPMLSIETVAAGGGSVCDFDGVKPIVGPRSAGASPGPACYGAGGPLCITDANVLLGRVPEDQFPFPLDRAAATARLDAIIEHIRTATGRAYSRQELATGFVRIANTHMAGAIRRISVERGVDPRDYCLVSFGGAGAQHACAIADELGIRNVLLHPLAGLLSAYGIGAADVRRFGARDVGARLNPQSLADLAPTVAALEHELRDEVAAQGVPSERIEPARQRLDLRYAGQGTAIPVDAPTDGDWRAAFERRHRELYGFVFERREIEITAARLEVVGRTAEQPVARVRRSTGPPRPFRHDPVYFGDAWQPTPMFRRAALRAGDAIAGPAIVIEPASTIVIEPDWSAAMTERGDLVLTRDAGAPMTRPASTTATGDTPASRSDRPHEPATVNAIPDANRDTEPDACDPVTLELFSRLFMSIAEQMGAALQRTAISTNVKERLDFSCALYDGDARLVAHAPHVPVHLGAMEHCVRCLIEDIGGVARFRPGDVYVTNDPYRGGSHLPDVTVITPVFDASGRDVLFFCASRAHHAEIGGRTPGSMPPISRSLAEEGVLIRATRVVSQDEADPRDGRPPEREPGSGEPSPSATDSWDSLRAHLLAGPYPTRAVDENLADLQAQIAANRRGARLLDELIARHGHARVAAYMAHIQAAAETKMRAALSRLTPGEHRFIDHLDDGSPVAAGITIHDGRARVDFTGTGPVLPGNLNATPAIVASAVLYCFRCLIADDIPLNAGVLAPIEIVLPNCLLNPAPDTDPKRCPAVAGGNVETSQRIVDCIFGALGVVAASQGTMNNVAFGDARFGYYETVGGGAGAGDGFAGEHAVHVHMTNTRLTDVEVLEYRYPVRLRRFAVRTGSGGSGRWPGGDGIVREYAFLAPVELSLLTQRRTTRPYGLHGGQPGAAGRNTLLRADGRREELSSIAHVRVAPGDVLILETPGGGGWGGEVPV